MSLPDWSAMQTDILQEISCHAANDADYVRFRSVCTSWHSAATKRPQIPWLAVNYHDGIANIGLGFCNFPDEEAYPSPLLPEGLSLGKLTVGCARGWIALIDNIPGISLHNPFTGTHVRLPVLADSPLEMGHFHLYKINPLWLAYKVVLSSDPREDDCVVMALTDGEKNLIFCRPKDASWTRLPPVRELYDGFVFSDIIFYERKFYVVCNYRVFAWDPAMGDPKVTEILPADPLFSDGKRRVGIGDYLEDRKDCTYKSFLVVSSGDLLLVGIMCPHSEFDCYYGDCDDCAEFKFEVFRIDFVFTGTSKGKMRFVKQESLGGRSLFVGKKCMSASASMGNSTRCKGNCVYLSLSVSISVSPDVGDLYIWPGGRRYFLNDNDCYGNETEEVIIVFNIEDGSICSNLVFSTDRKDARACHWLTPSLR